MHTNWDMGVLLNRCMHQHTKEWLPCVFPRTCRGLQNDRAIDLLSGLHDGMDLLHIVHIKCWQSVMMLSGVV
jgi:hypothetical protein